jgi:beta-lysine N6-acetyltransferase
MTNDYVFFEQEEINKETFHMKVTKDHFNQRLKVEDYRGNIKLIASYVDNLSLENKYAKAIVKTRAEDVPYLLQKGFIFEAVFTRYFNGSDAVAMTKYYEPTRRNSDKWIKEDEILKNVSVLTKNASSSSIPENFKLRKATVKDAVHLAKLYSKVFEIYPTPLNNPDYIKEVMQQDTVFYVILAENDEIISAASAEINSFYHNAELTDCATLSEYRKLGLMKVLLTKLEEELLSKQIYCSYSIARALSFGMNAAFHQLGYTYTGRLANNCYIFDKLEDMNVWVKDLSHAKNSSS